MRVGIICEGSTDFAVLEALALRVAGASECKLLQPDFDRLRHREATPGPGWQGVRRFLRTSGPALFLGVYDAIIIHVDASVRHDPEIAARLEKSAKEDNELEPLCRHVKGWAGKLPDAAVIVLPREELESWLLAAHTAIKDVEAVADPAEVLAGRGIIPRRNGEPDKTEEQYRELATSLVRLAQNRKRLAGVPELGRFLFKLHKRKLAI
jgi:hypothetical protein